MATSLKRGRPVHDSASSYLSNAKLKQLADARVYLFAGHLGARQGRAQGLTELGSCMDNGIVFVRCGLATPCAVPAQRNDRHFAQS